MASEEEKKLWNNYRYNEETKEMEYAPMENYEAYDKILRSEHEQGMHQATPHNMCLVCHPIDESELGCPPGCTNPFCACPGNE